MKVINNYGIYITAPDQKLLEHSILQISDYQLIFAIQHFIKFIKRAKKSVQVMIDVAGKRQEMSFLDFWKLRTSL